MRVRLGASTQARSATSLASSGLSSPEHAYHTPLLLGDVARGQDRAKPRHQCFAGPEQALSARHGAYHVAAACRLAGSVSSGSPGLTVRVHSWRHNSTKFADGKLPSGINRFICVRFMSNRAFRRLFILCRLGIRQADRLEPPGLRGDRGFGRQPLHARRAVEAVAGRRRARGCSAHRPASRSARRGRAR